ncbi:hypothetical protein [Actinoplanes sp. URMC 104]|uniref:hypothetical protein n=1 Tax=Actinoplanes sp. URMC 104 TaxID=3423409 RepID=UPI003F1BFB3F
MSSGSYTRRPLQVVPDELAATLRRLHDETLFSRHDKRFHVALHKAFTRGWSMAALAVALGKTPEAVGRMVYRYAGQHADLTGVDIPYAPPFDGPSPNTPPKLDVLALVPADRVQRIRELRDLAATTHTGHPPGHPVRQAGAMLAAELYDLIFVQGLPGHRVAKDIVQLQANAVAQRLRKHNLPGSLREFHAAQHQLAA